MDPDTWNRFIANVLIGPNPHATDRRYEWTLQHLEIDSVDAMLALDDNQQKRLEYADPTNGNKIATTPSGCRNRIRAFQAFCATLYNEKRMTDVSSITHDEFMDFYEYDFRYYPILPTTPKQDADSDSPANRPVDCRPEIMQDDISLPRSRSKTRTVVRSGTPIHSTDDSTPTTALTCFNTNFELSSSNFLVASSELSNNDSEFDFPNSEPAIEATTNREVASTSGFLIADSDFSYYDTMNDQNEQYDGDPPNQEASTPLSTPMDAQSDDYSDDSNSLSTMGGEF